MAYKKPEIVAKSEAKQSFVAGCQVKEYKGACGPGTTAFKCMLSVAK